jgi:hypothetical protein
MKKTIKLAITFSMAIITAGLLSFPASAQKQNKGAKTSDVPSDAVKLAYNLPAGKALAYASRTNITQTMDMNGSTMDVNVAVNLVCSFTATGKDGNNLKLEVKIDTLSQTVDSPMSQSGGPISEVQGKTFNMVLAPNGKEIDVKDAEKITYSAEGQETNVSQSFIEYFANLPEKEIKPGDMWTTNDTVNSKGTTMSVIQIVKADQKYEGIVEIDGLKCAKITASVSGIREQKGENQGMDIFIKGTFTGTSEIYFAVKEGFMVKEVSNSKMVGNVEISGAQNMTMPLTADTKSVKYLKK